MSQATAAKIPSTVDQDPAGGAFSYCKLLVRMPISIAHFLRLVISSFLLSAVEKLLLSSI